MEHTVTVTYGSPKPTSTYRMSYEIENLVAITTKVEYERYERNQPYERHDDQPYTIEPFTKSFSRPNLPDDWTTFVHPEGVRYFLKETRPIPVLTEAYIYSPEIHNQIESYISQIFSYINRNSIAFEKSFLVLELRQSGRCGYYFVDHTNKCLFWLDPFEFSHLLDPLKIPYTASLVGLVMHSHYWYHNELFPHVYQSTEGDLSEISDILVYSIGDLLTAGPNSVVSYDLDTLKASLELVKHFQKQDQSLQRRSPGGARFIYRMASYLYHDRFLNLHGEPGARLDAGQSIYGPQPEKNSLLMKILSPLMIYGPDSHLYRLEETTVDYMEGSQLFDQATVVLNANVAFLAIQSVDEAAAPDRRTDSQRASYFSVLTSLGSIIFGLLLVRQHREVMTTQFVVNRSASHLGLETLAMMFSLPYTLLMWS
ncbi:hypothetical protein NLJ89_g1562 [Agrocybe chaxingu]|uniref:Uncharacterized protein n=1 Tax=Agrocybe chaxingu TaxID=84603 RepID=A0A9W8MZU1_9AGAR|nr:hypothetical protein NLJ89_g1562 [Agrocybe chaxingu]